MRREVGLLLRQVGDEFDIDKAAVASWESGRTCPTPDKLERLDALYEARGEVVALYAAPPSLTEQVERLTAMLTEALARVQHVENIAMTFETRHGLVVAEPKQTAKRRRASASTAA
jgi:transcriptional regulator with XRE-family HTH domain